MKLIAHRGLTDGPNPAIENSPAQILLAIKLGFECEIDLWVINSELYLGHDGPTYPITPEFLKTGEFWIHAKNLGALRWLTDTCYNYFWHQNDDYVITSYRWIWTYPNKELTQKSIAVLPEWNDPEFKNLPINCYAICSDYVTIIKEKI